MLTNAKLDAWIKADAAGRDALDKAEDAEFDARIKAIDSLYYARTVRHLIVFKGESNMQLDQIIKSSTSFFAITLAAFLFANGVAQAQCNFFTGWGDNKDGTVTDIRNGLIWKRCAEGFEFSNGVCTGDGTKANWESAKLIAQQSRFLDKSDWRLPTKEEFEAVLGIYDECKANHDGEYAASKAIAHSDGWFWSSSPYDDRRFLAHGVDFKKGFINDACDSSKCMKYVRLVRAGQILGGEAASEFVNEITEKEDRRRAEAPKILSEMPKEKLCAAYGSALREGQSGELGSFPSIAKLVKKELVRRNLKLDDSLVRNGHIKMGVSECQLYASWGIPEDQNRSVGSWGVHTQHVYGSGSYVYTENGRVTSWQD